MANHKIPYESWSAMNDEPILAKRERDRMSMAWRLWEVSVASQNNWGHAAFRDGELARLCCGKDTDANRGAVRRAMDTLAEMGRIAPRGPGGSTQQCILVNRDYVCRGAGKGARQHVCRENSHTDTSEIPWTPQPVTLTVVTEAKPAGPDDDPWASPQAPTVPDVASDGNPKHGRRRFLDGLGDGTYG